MENIDENKLDGFELVLHVAITKALKRDDKKYIFGTTGNPIDLIKYLDKYKELYKIWIRRANRKEDGMSGSIGGDYELYIEQ